MKKLQTVSFLALVLEVLLWTAGRTLFTMPDWGVRFNGIMMLVTMPLLVFATVRSLRSLKKE